MPVATRRHLLVSAVAVALMLTGLPVSGLPAASAIPGASSSVFVNELHYDNVGGDTDELVEVAAPAGSDLSTWSIVFYNGNGGGRYASADLSDGTASTVGDTTFVVVEQAGIQNGSPDGLALVDGTTVVQLLSYEGAFTATDGVAQGESTTDIQVAEPSNTPVGTSLQLTGTGSTYGDFEWSGPADATPGAPNVGQSIGGGDVPATLSCEDLFVVGDRQATGEVTATDPDDELTTLEVTTPLDGVTLSGAQGVAGGLTATLSADGAALAEQSTDLTITSTDADGDSATCTVTLEVVEITTIGEIQGVVPDGAENADAFESPLVGERVVVQAVVHQRTRSDAGQYGLFLENTDETADGDPTTSDGIFVFLNRNVVLDDVFLEPGDEIVLAGTVTEFFSLTQLSSPELVEVSGRVDVDDAVPPFVALPPDDLEEAHVYWERREGMRAQVEQGSVVQGGRDVFGGDASELWTIPGSHPVAGRDETFSNRVFRDAHPLDNDPALFDDGNGYRVLLGDFGLKWEAIDSGELIAPGRTFDTVTNAPTGGVYYSFGKYSVQVVTQPQLQGGANPAVNAPPAEPDEGVEWSMAAANVENLYDVRDDPFDPADSLSENYVPDTVEDYQALLDGLAEQIAVDLHAPDVVLVQEAEDQDICAVQDGALSCGQVDDADGKPDTLQELALVLADDHGVTYDAALDRDGADDRGITSGFLYRADRVELVEAAPDDVILGQEPGVEYPTAPLDSNADVSNPKALNAELPQAVIDADEASSASYFDTDGSDVFTRAPQVARFRVWRDGIGTSANTEVWAVSNHFSSGPDRRVPQRTEQAAYNAAIVAAVEAALPDAQVAVGGDVNVYPRPDDPYGRGNPHDDGVTDQLGPLYDAGLANLWDDVLADAPSSAYSYVFDGQAQTLDSIFANDALAESLVQARFAHINADWPAEHDGDGARGVSDHDPLVARLLLVAGVDDLAVAVQEAIAAGLVDGRRGDILLRRVERIEGLLERGQTAAATSQLQAFAAQVRGFSPRFIDPDAAAVLVDTSAVLIDVLDL